MRRLCLACPIVSSATRAQPPHLTPYTSTSFLTPRPLTLILALQIHPNPVYHPRRPLYALTIRNISAAIPFLDAPEQTRRPKSQNSFVDTNASTCPGSRTLQATFPHQDIEHSSLIANHYLSLRLHTQLPWTQISPLPHSHSSTHTPLIHPPPPLSPHWHYSLTPLYQLVTLPRGRSFFLPSALPFPQPPSGFPASSPSSEITALHRRPHCRSPSSNITLELNPVRTHQPPHHR